MGLLSLEKSEIKTWAWQHPTAPTARVAMIEFAIMPSVLWLNSFRQCFSVFENSLARPSRCPIHQHGRGAGSSR